MNAVTRRATLAGSSATSPAAIVPPTDAAAKLDAELLQLEASWRALCKELSSAPDEKSKPLDERLQQIEHELWQRAAGSFAGLAAKLRVASALAVMQELGAGQNTDHLPGRYRPMMSALYDAERLARLPPIRWGVGAEGVVWAAEGPSWPPSPYSPSAGAPAGHGDLLLIEAEREIGRLEGAVPPGLDEFPEDVGTRINELDDLIAKTPASCLAGAAVKLRRLLDRSNGLLAGAADWHLSAVATALAVVEASVGDLPRPIGVTGGSANLPTRAAAPRSTSSQASNAAKERAAWKADEEDDWAEMSFRKEGASSDWQPAAIQANDDGGYIASCYLGTAYACELIGHVRRHGPSEGPETAGERLADVVEDMFKGGRFGPTEKSFFRALGEFVAGGRVCFGSEAEVVFVAPA